MHLFSVWFAIQMFMFFFSNCFFFSFLFQTKKQLLLSMMVLLIDMFCFIGCYPPPPNNFKVSDVILISICIMSLIKIGLNLAVFLKLLGITVINSFSHAWFQQHIAITHNNKECCGFPATIKEKWKVKQVLPDRWWIQTVLYDISWSCNLMSLALDALLIVRCWMSIPAEAVVMLDDTYWIGSWITKDRLKTHCGLEKWAS